MLERPSLLWDFALSLALRWRASSLVAALTQSCPILVRLTLGCRRPFLGTGNGLSVLLQLLQWLRDFDGASGWLGPKLLRPRLWVCELQLTTCF